MSMHVIPLNDERKHERRSSCWCGPAIEWADPEHGRPYWNGPLVTHHSVDCREVSEKVTGEGVAPELKWAVFEE